MEYQTISNVPRDNAGGMSGGICASLALLAKASSAAAQHGSTLTALVAAALSVNPRPAITLLAELLAGVSPAVEAAAVEAEGGAGYLLTCVAAFAALIARAAAEGHPPMALVGPMRTHVESYLTSLVLPVFATTADSMRALQSAVASSVGEAVLLFSDSVELLAQLVQMCANSARAAQERAGRLADAYEQHAHSQVGTVDGWCCLARHLLLVAASMKAPPPNQMNIQTPSTSPASARFTAVWAATAQLTPTILRELQHACKEAAPASAHVTELLQVVCATDPNAHCTAYAIWSILQESFQAGIHQRRVALAAVVRFLPALIPISRPPGSDSGFNAAMQDVTLDASADIVLQSKVFWQSVRSSLMDNEAAVRKLATCVLKHALASGACPPDEGLDALAMHWDAYQLLYDSMDNFAAHLIESAWGQMDTLHPAAFSGEGEAKVGFQWMGVLWSRGIQHCNIPVRRMALASFFSREWSERQMTDVPVAFLTGPLKAALCDAANHKEFGSLPRFASECTEGAVRFHQQYFFCQARPEVWASLLVWVEAWAQGTPSRAAFATFLACLEAAVDVLGPPAEEVEGVAAQPLHTSSPPGLGAQQGTMTVADRLLAALSMLATRVKSQYGVQFKACLLTRLLSMAARACPVPFVSLPQVTLMLALLPRDMLCLDSELHKTMVNWLTPLTKQADPSREYSAAELLSQGLDPVRAGEVVANQRMVPELRNIAAGVCHPAPDDTWLAAQLVSALENHLATMDDAQKSSLSDAVSEAEMCAWQVLSAQYALMATLVVDRMQQQRLCAVVKTALSSVYRRTYQPRGWRERVMMTARAMCAESFRNPSVLGAVGHDKATSLSTTFQPGVSPKATGPSWWWLASSMCRIVKECLGEIVAAAEGATQLMWQPWDKMDEGSAAFSVLKVDLALTTLVETAEWRWWWLTPAAGTVDGFLWKFVGQFAQKLSFIVQPSAADAAVAAKCVSQEVERFSVALEAMVNVCGAIRKESIRREQQPVVDLKQYAYHCLSVDPQNAMAAVCQALTRLMEQVDLAETQSLSLRCYKRNIHTTLVVRKWRCIYALLSIEVPDGTAWTGQLAVDRLPPDVLSQVLAHAVNKLDTADDSDLVFHLQCVRRVLPVAMANSSIMGKAALLIEPDSWKPDDSVANVVTVVRNLITDAWSALSGCNKRKLASVSAFMTTCFHPMLFKELHLHGTDEHGNINPITWAVGQILKAGQKSARLMRVAAMQLCGTWLQFPDVARALYLKDILTFAMHGVAPGYRLDHDLQEELGAGVTGEEYAMLPPAPDPDLAKTFENTEMFVRVAAMQLSTELANTCELEGPENAAKRLTSRQLGKALLLETLRFAITDTEMLLPLYKKGSGTHRRKIRLWQFLCTLTPFLDDENELVVDSLIWKAAELANQPTVRQYIELFLVRFTMRFPHMLRDRLLAKLLEYNGNPPVISSYMHVVIAALMHSSEEIQRNLLPDVAAAVLPWMTIHHHNLRAFSHVVAFKLLEKFPAYSNAWSGRALPLSEPGAGSADTRYIASLHNFLIENTDVAKLREITAKQLEWDDPVHACTAHGILMAAEDGSAMEASPVPLFDRVAQFLGEVRQDLRTSQASDKATVIRGASASTAIAAFDRTSESSSACSFQRKIPSALVEMAMVPSSLGGDEEQSAAFTLETLHLDMVSLMDDNEHALLVQSANNTRTSMIGQYGKTARQELIVVASLIDKIPNLAGLARSCEVFQAYGLALSNPAVVNDPEFKQISVTAEKWVPIMEVPESGLSSFLARKRDEGWSLVGLEQTTTSECITQYKFHSKTVLLLGREKEGIPVEFIQMLDACVEIPQLGMIRSLNVHVSAAIAMYQYTAIQRGLQ